MEAQSPPLPLCYFLNSGKGPECAPLVGGLSQVTGHPVVTHHKVGVNLFQVHSSFIVKFYFKRNLVPKIWNFNTTLTGESGDNHPLLSLSIKLKIGLSSQFDLKWNCVIKEEFLYNLDNHPLP